MKHLAKAGNNEKTNEWYTPLDIIQRVRTVMGGINCDPASCEIAQATVQADTYYTVEDDGLSKRWVGSVFLNPPYQGGLIDKFIYHLINEKSVTEYVTLVNNATETKWAQSLLNDCDCVCFINYRIKFYNIYHKEGSPLQGQVVYYRGDRIKEFIDEFLPIGIVFKNGMKLDKEAPGISLQQNIF